MYKDLGSLSDAKSIGTLATSTAQLDGEASLAGLHGDPRTSILGQESKDPEIVITTDTGTGVV